MSVIPNTISLNGVTYPLVPGTDVQKVDCAPFRCRLVSDERLQREYEDNLATWEWLKFNGWIDALGKWTDKCQ